MCTTTTTINTGDNERMVLVRDYNAITEAEQHSLIKKLSPLQRRKFVEIILGEDVNHKQTRFFKRKIELMRFDKKITKNMNYELWLYRILKAIKRAFNHFTNYTIFNGMTYKTAIEIIHANSLNHSVKVYEAKVYEETNSVSIDELTNIIKEMRLNDETNLATKLREHNFPTVISRVRFKNFKQEEAIAELFHGLDLSDIHFEKCSFFRTNFDTTLLENTRFFNCKFYFSVFCKSEIKNCSFTECKFREVVFLKSSFDATNINSCYLIGCSFEESTLKNSSFCDSALPGTHFLQAQVENLNMNRCNLRNTVFLGLENSLTMDDYSRKTQTITKPVVAILAHSFKRGLTVPKVYSSIDHFQNAIPIKIHCDPLDLSEATRGLVSNHLDLLAREKEPFIAKNLIARLKNDASQIPVLHNLFEKTCLLSEHVDSIVLTGGEDIPPRLYGEELQGNPGEEDYARSLLELSLIERSISRGIPMMALCRGFQIANIYHGARMLQDISGHKGIQTLEMTETNEVGSLSPLLRKNFNVIVFHHQGIPLNTKPLDYLTVIAHKDGIVKACEPTPGGAAPSLLLQFHPEFMMKQTSDSFKHWLADNFIELFLSHENLEIWKFFQQSSHAYRNKKALLRKIRTTHALMA